MDDRVDNPTEGVVTTDSDSTPSPVVRCLIAFCHQLMHTRRRPWTGTTWTGASLANTKHTGVT